MMTSFPHCLYAGVSSKVSLALSPAKGYPRTDNWELVFFLQNDKGSLSLPLTWEDTHWVLQLDANDLNAIADTQKTPTFYELIAVKPQGVMSFPYVLNASEETVSLEKGRLYVARSLNASTGAKDARTHEEKVLDNIRAVLEKSATKEQERYMVNGVELWRRSLQELSQLQKEYALKVAIQKRHERGLAPFDTVKLGFS